MPVLRRELAFSPLQASPHTGDWWHLVLDSDDLGLWVEHTWSHASPHGDGQIARGEERFGINDFLMLMRGQAAHPVLLGALNEMFRNLPANPDRSIQESFPSETG
jgi:hypothetical protein